MSHRDAIIYPPKRVSVDDLDDCRTGYVRFGVVNVARMIVSGKAA